jgi:transmembrane sensor
MNSALDKHIEAARREIRVRSWRSPDVEAAWAELAQRESSMRFRRRMFAALGGAAVFTVALVLVFGREGMFGKEEQATELAHVQREPALALEDGTRVHVAPGTQLAVLARTDERVVIRMQPGSAHFQVRHNPKRLFQVEAGSVVVQDLGTVFQLDHRGSEVAVSVTEGSVAVSFEADGQPRSVTLGQGSSGTYPAEPAAKKREAPGAAPAEPPALVDTAHVQASPGPTSKLATANTEARSNADWRELARGGEHRRAFEAISRRGFRDVNEDPSDLLLASDVARHSGHPGNAATWLRKLLSNHPTDPRAPSAAFSLGWILMTELGRPREAAAMFARAEALAPRGNLAEEAFARSVEAWSRAGESARAKADVERYRKRYPKGRYLGMLDRLVSKP